MEIYIAILIGCSVLLTIVVAGLLVAFRHQFHRQGGEYPQPRVSGRFLQDSRAGERDADDELVERFRNYFETEKPYLANGIRAGDVAQHLGVGKNRLSKALKSKLKMNFCQVVHYYRVKEAMRIYSARPNMSVGQLAAKVGFNSITTFITAFGRHTGSTPAEWCRLHKNGSHEK